MVGNNIEEQYIIYNWIKEKVKKKNIEFELIFIMSENGKKGNIFHNICDDQGPTLTLIKTKDNKIFGGFTPLSWKSEKEKEDKYDE